MDEKVLEILHVKKYFGPVKALQDGTLDVYKGKLTVLMGENGAGKSTLMNVVTGLLKPNDGEIKLYGKKVSFDSINDSLKAGIAIIHQELRLVEELTVMENIFLGCEVVNKLGILNKPYMRSVARKYLDMLDLNFSVNTKIANLSIAKQQMVEIAKALSKKADILILDEPTSSIGNEETQKLFSIINKLKISGKSMIYITHRMAEIKAIGDYVTVFRDGKFIFQKPIEDTNDKEIINSMVGRELKEQFPTKVARETKTILELQGISSKWHHNVNLEIKSNEILGITGLIGAGRTELAKIIIGDLVRSSGKIYYNNKIFNSGHPGDAIKHGIFYLSEDRKVEGLHVDKSIRFNATLSSLKRCYFPYTFFVNPIKEKNFTNASIERMRIRTPSEKQIISNLSGGNQQKVVIAKGLLTKPKVFIFDEPTRGVDVGARKEIYDIMHELKNQGVAIVIISSDMPEVIGLCDRVVVMYEGRIGPSLYGDQITQEKIMTKAVGGN